MSAHTNITKLMMGKIYLDREDLLMRDTRETKRTWKEFKKSTCKRDIKMKTFLHRSVDIWNRLDKEVVQTKSLSVFKEN